MVLIYLGYSWSQPRHVLMSIFRSVEVNVQIVQEPQNHMESDKIKTSGGSTGILSLLGLFALILLRRK